MSRGRFFSGTRATATRSRRFSERRAFRILVQPVCDFWLPIGSLLPKWPPRGGTSGGLLPPSREGKSRWVRVAGNGAWLPRTWPTDREADMGRHGPLPMPGAKLKPSPGSALTDLPGAEPTRRRPLLCKDLLHGDGETRSRLSDEQGGHGRVAPGSVSLLRQGSFRLFRVGQDPNRRMKPFKPGTPACPGTIRCSSKNEVQLDSRAPARKMIPNGRRKTSIPLFDLRAGP